MFKRTLLRLALLNALTVFILIITFGASMYAYTQHRMYQEADKTLEDAWSGFDIDRIRDMLHADEERHFHSMTYVLWDNQGDFVRQVPSGFFQPQDLTDMRLLLLDGDSRLKTMRFHGHDYRILTESVNFSGIPPATLQMVYDLEPGKKVLHNLLLIIVIGVISSFGIALLAGLFLANRSLIPIRRAWDKQQRFVSDASHELRTPLAVLQINLERLFRHPDHTIEQESRKIAVMIDETKRIGKLVADLLTLARSDSNQLEIVREPVRLDQLLRNIAAEFHDAAGLKNIAIQTEFSESAALSVWGDRDRLHQMLVILLDNALKYSTEGTITLNCTAAGSHVTIEVSDTGIGISSEDLPFIFDRFYRADKARNRTQGGTGLGLSIAKWIVEAHHGSISARSIQGVGTTIQIVLPAS